MNKDRERPFFPPTGAGFLLSSFVQDGRCVCLEVAMKV